MRKTPLAFLLLATACGDDVPAPMPDAAAPSVLNLPGSAYYPENLYAAPDGTLYVPSLGTGEVVAFKPGATTPTTFIAAGDPKGVSGLYATASNVWLCAVDLTTQPPTTEVRTYDLAGTKLASYPFSQPAFCNDLVQDAAGNVYVSDSFGAIWKLPAGGSSLAVWSNDAQLAPPSPTGFGADGIALDGAGNLYVTNFSAATLLRIPITNGSAGTVTPITVSPAPTTPDGLRWLGANTLVFADGAAGTLTSVALATGTATQLATGLDGPTSVAKIGATYWVSEGQIGHLTGQIAGPPNMPFVVRAIAAH